MTAAELLDHDPAVFEKMTDKELAEYVADLLPLARAAYVGKSVADGILLPSGRRTTARQIADDNQTMMNVLRQAGIQIP